MLEKNAVGKAVAFNHKELLNPEVLVGSGLVTFTLHEDNFLLLMKRQRLGSVSVFRSKSNFFFQVTILTTFFTYVEKMSSRNPTPKSSFAGLQSLLVKITKLNKVDDKKADFS